MKTYHMYHAESISAESKLKEAEKQEEKQFNKSGDLSMNLLRHEDRPQRRSSVKKIEKMKEKVCMFQHLWGLGRSTLGVRANRSFPVGAMKRRTKKLWFL